MAHPEFQNSVGAMPLPEEGVSESAERVKPAGFDFQALKQRMKFPP
jgi:hypothetical protein